MRTSYTLIYTDHCRNQQKIKMSSFEDAERVAQYLADLYGEVRLLDDYVPRIFKRVETEQKLETEPKPEPK